MAAERAGGFAHARLSGAAGARTEGDDAHECLGSRSPSIRGAKPSSAETRGERRPRGARVGQPMTGMSMRTAPPAGLAAGTLERDTSLERAPRKRTKPLF